jgi:hypothetical protein
MKEKNVEGLKNLVMFCFLSFGELKIQFKIKEEDFFIFKKILIMHDIHSEDHIDNLVKSYMSRGFIHSQNNFQKLNLLSPQNGCSLNFDNSKIYLISSKGFQTILYELFSGHMRIDKSVELILSLFCAVLVSHNAKQILNQQSPISNKSLALFIDNMVKRKAPIIDVSNYLEFEKKTGLSMEKYLNSHDIPKSIKKLLVMDFLLQNKVFYQEFRNFVDLLVNIKDSKSQYLFSKIRNIIKENLNKIMRISTNLGLLEELSEEDFTDNLKMLFKCNFLKKTFSVIQIKEAVDVIKNKWFNE